MLTWTKTDTGYAAELENNRYELTRNSSGRFTAKMNSVPLGTKPDTLTKQKELCEEAHSKVVSLVAAFASSQLPAPEGILPETPLPPLPPPAGADAPGTGLPPIPEDDEDEATEATPLEEVVTDPPGGEGRLGTPPPTNTLKGPGDDSPSRLNHPPLMKEAGYLIQDGRPIAAGVVCKMDPPGAFCPAHGVRHPHREPQDRHGRPVRSWLQPART